MVESRLQSAVKLVKSRAKAEARLQFQQVLQDDPHNELAWLWFVESLDSHEMRVRALETCLRINPNAKRARAGLTALKNAQIKQGTLAEIDSFQPLITITGNEDPTEINLADEEAWVLSGGARVFTVPPEVVSPEEVAEREARVYDLIGYRSEIQPNKNPWEELQQTGDTIFSSSKRRFRQPSDFFLPGHNHYSLLPSERLLSLTYTSFALLVVLLLIVLLLGTGRLMY